MKTYYFCYVSKYNDPVTYVLTSDWDKNAVYSRMIAQLFFEDWNREDALFELFESKEEYLKNREELIDFPPNDEYNDEGGCIWLEPIVITEDIQI